MVEEAFIWCKDQHYFALADESCHQSGWRNPLATEVARYCGDADRLSYGAVLKAGAQEPHLVNLLFVSGATADVVRRFHGYDRAAPTELIEAVERRNRWVLQNFPEGLLHAALRETRARRRLEYCRKPGKTMWHLVDDAPTPRRMRSRRQSEREADTITPRGILDDVLARLGGGPVEFRQFDIDLPAPEAFEERLMEWSARSEEIRRRQHPLIPRGHLHFADLRRPTTDEG